MCKNFNFYKNGSARLLADRITWNDPNEFV